MGQLVFNWYFKMTQSNRKSTSCPPHGFAVSVSAKSNDGMELIQDQSHEAVNV